MRRMRTVAALALLGALAGCGGDRQADTPEPRLGGPSAASAAPPTESMDDLEQPVAQRLASELDDDGLTLEYVQCPRWSGKVPAVLECKGYVDGVVGEVVVELSHRAGRRVEFDARLEAGVLAMTRLVDRLERQGYHDVDCGPTRAYPARVGMRILCRAKKGGEVGHVVATVVDRHGAVRIQDY